MQNDKQGPEKLRQRRAESALARPCNIYPGNKEREIGKWKGRVLKDGSQGKNKVPNTEKNNLKHFQFLTSPSVNQSILDTHDEIKKEFRKLYLQPKPNTSSGISRAYTRKEKTNILNPIINLKDNFHFHSIGSSYSAQNDFSIDENSHSVMLNDDERFSASKLDTSLQVKYNEDTGKTALNIGKMSIQRLQDEVRKLQVYRLEE